MSRERSKSKPRIGRSLVIGGVSVAGILGLILYASAGLRRSSCEVCMTFNGRTACRKADGANPEEARRTATDMACAVLASGMTESLQCTRSVPKSETCGGGY